MARSIDEQIMERAVKDPEFRRNLVTSPNATLEKEFKVTLPAGVSVKVHEDSDTIRHLVLPKTPGSRADLSDAELATAAGGMRMRGGDSNCGDGCCTCGVSTHQTIFTK